MEDSYFFLLEQPRLRQYGLCGERIRYRTKAFDPAFYAAANGLNFATDDEAYHDWLTRGRGLGLPYARGRDTILKIVLKAKDEPDLLPHWIAHHARIVGHDNLIILDCGSTDPAYRALLDEHADRVLILRYPLYYDYLHTRRANAGFFDLVARNCRYLAVLDADEYLVGRDGADFSGAAVTRLLARSDETIHAGTWISTMGAAIPGAPVALDLSRESLVNGAIAGKAVIRSSAIDRIEHIGHNMHDASVLAEMTAGSFGQLAIVHLTTLDPAIARRRYLAHLRAKGVAAADTDAEGIAAIAANEEHPLPVRAYARRWLAAADPAPADPEAPLSRLAAGAGTERIEPLAEALDALDYTALARMQVDEINR